MASTIQLSRAVSLAQLFVRQIPLAVNTNSDPALSIGDWVRGFILAPPFAWRWNRATLSITLNQGQQDYQQNLPKFGWLEQATVADGNGVVHTLEVSNNLTEESVQNLPTRISARLDDGNGNVTFRILPAPDQAYTLNVSYQMAAPTFGSLNETWAPIPDYFSYLYNQGFMAKTYEYVLDDRFVIAMQTFVRQVVAANTGLSDSEVDIFLADFVSSQRYSQSQLEQGQLGRQGRLG